MRTRKLKQIILDILTEEEGYLMARGILYRDAQNRGYKGNQERLLKCANEMACEGLIAKQRAGMFQYFHYRTPKMQNI